MRQTQKELNEWLADIEDAEQELNALASVKQNKCRFFYSNKRNVAKNDENLTFSHTMALD